MSNSPARAGPGRAWRWRLIAVITVVVLSAAAGIYLLRGDALRGVDDLAWTVVVDRRRWWWDVLAEAVSEATPSLGGGLALICLATLTSWRSGRRTPLVLSCGALGLLGAVVAAGKLLLHQGSVAGADGTLPPDPRFPNGPVTTAIMVGGVAALLLRSQLRPRLHRAFLVLVPAVVAAISASEVYLGQHRLTDILASWVLGVALLVVVCAAANTLINPVSLSVRGQDPTAPRRPAGSRPPAGV